MAGQVWCKHVKENGTSCAAKAMESGYCWFHDPAIKEQRDEARQRGAKQTKQRRTKILLPTDTADLPLNNPEEVAAALARTFNEVRRGEVDVRTANCLALIGSTLLRAFHGEEKLLTLNVKPAPPEKTLIGPEVLEQLLADARREQNRPQIGLRELSPSAENREGIDHAE